MKARNLFGWWLVVLAILPRFAAAGDAASPPANNDEGLYYAVDKAFDTTSKVEARLTLGYDISNPYLQVLNGQAGFLYLASPYLGVGLEAMGATSSKRQTAIDLEGELARHGYKLAAYAPEYGLTALARVTPVAGLVNLLSSQVVRAEISLLGRAGAVNYGPELGTGPSLGFGLEIGIRTKTGFGVVTAITWDWDKVSDIPWQSRTGFRIGPSFRF